MHISLYGNSIVTKVLALGLSQTNHEIDWICPKYNSISRPIALSQSSIKLLHKLNIWHMFDPNSIQAIDAMNIGTTNIDLNIDAYKNLESELAYIIQTHDLDNILMSALNFTSRIKKIHADNISNYFDGYTNTLTIENHEKIKTDLLIVTQGNAINYFKDIKIIEKDYQHIAITTILQADIPHNGQSYQWFYDKDIIALLPMPSNQFCLIWSSHKSHEILMQDIIQVLNHNIQDIKKLQISSCVQEIKTFPLGLKYINKFFEQRTLLIGDAAHRIHPLAGQGLNIGLRDVDVLLTTLDNSCNTAQLNNRLRRFSAQRSIDIFKLAFITNSLYEINNFSSSLLKIAFKAANALPILQKIMIKQAN